MILYWSYHVCQSWLKKHHIWTGYLIFLLFFCYYFTPSHYFSEFTVYTNARFHLETRMPCFYFGRTNLNELNSTESEVWLELRISTAIFLDLCQQMTVLNFIGKTFHKCAGLWEMWEDKNYLKIVSLPTTCQIYLLICCTECTVCDKDKYNQNSREQEEKHLLIPSSSSKTLPLKA